MEQDDQWEGERRERSRSGLASRREAFHLGFAAGEQGCRAKRLSARVSPGDSLFTAFSS
jgi:hypothetical protein